MARKKANPESNTATIEPPVSAGVEAIRQRVEQGQQEARSAWRELIAAAADRQHVPPYLAKTVWEEAGFQGDWENALRTDTDDLRAVRAGDRAAKADSLGQFVKKHGDRKTLAQQRIHLQQRVRDVSKLLALHDSLEVTSVQPVQLAKAIRLRNKRLFGEGNERACY